MTVLLDIEFVAFKTFTVLGYFVNAHIKPKLEYGPMPNVMVAVQRRKVWLTPTT